LNIDSSNEKEVIFEVFLEIKFLKFFLKVFLRVISAGVTCFVLLKFGDFDRTVEFLPYSHLDSLVWASLVDEFPVGSSNNLGSDTDWFELSVDNVCTLSLVIVLDLLSPLHELSFLFLTNCSETIPSTSELTNLRFWSWHCFHVFFY